MQKTILCLFLLLVTRLAVAGSCVECSPTHYSGVEHVVTQYAPQNISPVQCCQHPDFVFTRLCDPDLSALAGVDQRYWKCAGGNGTSTAYTSVVEMTQAEKDQRDAADDPAPDPVRVVESPGGIIGGMQARDSSGTVRIGSTTNHDVWLARNNVDAVVLGPGGRVGIGYTNVSGLDAKPILYLSEGEILMTPVNETYPCNAARRGLVVVQDQGNNKPDRVLVCLQNGDDSTYDWVVLGAGAP